jgi:hypothetical protein
VPAGTASILDIGSGEGWTLGWFRGVPRRVGVDMDTAVLQRARRRYPDCDFQEIDGGRLPFEAGEFEVVILSEVLEHVGAENKQRVVDEALRVLCDGGRLIVTVPHASIFRFLDPLDYKRRFPRAYRFYRRLAGGSPQTAADIGHKHLSVAELMGLFAGRVEPERVALSGWLSPFFDLAQAVCTALPFVPQRLVWRLGSVKARESGVPAPRLLASHLRVVALKPGRKSVQALPRWEQSVPRLADTDLDGPSPLELREAEASPIAQEEEPVRAGPQGR